MLACLERKFPFDGESDKNRFVGLKTVKACDKCYKFANRYKDEVNFASQDNFVFIDPAFISIIEIDSTKTGPVKEASSGNEVDKDAADHHENSDISIKSIEVEDFSKYEAGDKGTLNEKFINPIGNGNCFFACISSALMG